MCRLGSFSHALLLTRRRILVAPPRCSPNTRLDNKPRGCVSGEQQGGADEILCRVRTRAWKNEPNLHILGLSMDNVGQFERITVINMQMNAYL